VSATYDLVIVGAGSAGLTGARVAAQLGAQVALVDRNPPGGDCLYSGCVPSKALIRAARVAWEIRRAADFGLPASEPRVDLARVMARIRQVIDRLYQEDSPAALARDGVEFIQAPASFADPHTILAGERPVHARRILLCTGARPRLPIVNGLPATPHETYQSIFNLTRLPRRLLVLGGGPVGVELAQAFQRLGSQVTLFQRAERILPAADPEASAILEDVLRRDGVDLRTGCAVEKVGLADTGGISVLAGGERLEGDLLLIASGRQPNLEDLALERGGVAFTSNGVIVDDALRTSQRQVFACGDLIGSHQFTHYAAWQAAIAVRNALLPGSSAGTRAHIPWTVFSDPEVARCGLTEPEARQRYGSDVAVSRWPFERVDRAQIEADRRGLLKVVHRRDGTLLGAHLVAGRAGEMIQEFVLAMDQGLRLDDLGRSIHVYPTYMIATQQLAASRMLDRLARNPAMKLAVRFGRWLP
jgi:pyruvate/2-oxoglutarate dehydrogenase complex dihydrolipoamide dehydrogenase (E3) component